jgi:hypothetical protein
VDDLKMEFSEENLEEVRKKARALFPSCMCVLFARKSNMKELRSYPISSFPRFFHYIPEEDFEDWTTALDFSMDRACCYDELKMPPHRLGLAVHRGDLPSDVPNPTFQGPF